jgi:dihydroorotate dehydrogenase
MPDWSYRTVLRPMMLSIGAERSRRIATATLAMLSRLPGGLAFIDFLGHMRADVRLTRRVGNLELAGPVALGALMDPSGKAAAAFTRFGAGLLEIGPVGEQPEDPHPAWTIDLVAHTVTPSSEIVAGLDEVETNLRNVPSGFPVCVRISGDGQRARRIASRLSDHAAMLVVPPDVVASVADLGAVIARIPANGSQAAGIASAAMKDGASGVWFHGAIDDVVRGVSEARAILTSEAIIVGGGVNEPHDVRRLLDAGADIAAVDAGLICSGPGLVKRCNEALLSTLSPVVAAEPLTLDATRRSWFWALLLGMGMIAGGALAMILASTRIVLPYDESLCGMTRDQLIALNPRLLPFMAHDRVSLSGTMLSIGILYAALGWCAIRRGAHWAQVAVVVSAIAGFFTFFFFLGFGYFDPFHAFVTVVMLQFTLLCLTMAPSPRQPVHAEWHETAAWRRGQWGQLLFITIGMVLTSAGLVISFIGCTSVFVNEDLDFMRTTAASLAASYDRLIPLVAHDRASLGGMLIANGIVIWLTAQWGLRGGERWLWIAFAWAGNAAFASAVAVHYLVGYSSWLHLAPAIVGWFGWNAALALTHEWLSPPDRAAASPEISAAIAR